MFKSLVLGLALLASCIQAYTPGACSGSSCASHDPALIKRADGTWFRFDTGGGMGISTASSIEGPWTAAGEVLSSGSSLQVPGNAGTDAWAPDVHYDSSSKLYYLYYTISSFGSQVSQIGVASSATMESGSWTDHGATGIASSSSVNYNAIDGNYITIGSSGYMVFGSFYDDIQQVKMASELKSSGTPYNIAFNSSGSHAEEGPFMYYNKPYYYLFFSSGSCCGLDTTPVAAGNEYRINVCRSSSGTGEFVDRAGKSCTAGGGTTVIASSGTTYAPGGQGVLYDSSVGVVLYYHYANTQTGISDADMRFGWNVLTFDDDWPVVA